MDLLKNLDFDGLHLFETSLIGKPITFQYIDQNILIVPCYNPIFVDLDKIEKCGNNCYLIFDFLEYFSLIQNIYNKQRTEFTVKSKKCHSSFDQEYANICNKLVSQGISEAGVGEFQLSILCRNFHIIVDDLQLNLKEINLGLILENEDIVHHLTFPELKKVNQILKENL